MNEMGKLEGKQPLQINGDCDCEEVCEATSSMESSVENGSVKSVASSLSEMGEDASSSTSNSSSWSSSNGPLYELSELMAHLPMKRGLSKFYDGKSQSHISFGSVKSLEDLAKRESPIRKKIKSCKSFGGGFDGHRSFNNRATISKKASRSRRKTNLLSGSGSAIPVKRPLIC